MRDRRIAVVTALPPSRTTLNEYGYHLVRSLAATPGVSEVVALVEKPPDGTRYPAMEQVTTVPCWRFGSPTNPVRIARTLRRLDADEVIFNIQFSSFGAGRITAALGLLAPLLSRLAGVRTITLLHNIVETVDLDGAGFGFGPMLERVMRGIGTVLTWLVLRSHLVAVTIPKYAEILRDKYAADNVVLIPHGAFDVLEHASPAPETAGPERILTFGKFGTYKKIESLIQAFHQLEEERDVELVIAGTDSPNAPGYLAEAEDRLGGPGIRFTGYVAEEDVPGLFRSATVVVFPYSATTGSSGVLHQAGSYARAAVMPDIGDFSEVVSDEGYAAEYFTPDDTDDLARAIRAVLDDPHRRNAIGHRNWLASRGVGIDEVAAWYVAHLDALAATT